MEVLNTNTNWESDSTAHVFLKNGAITQICFESNRCVSNFDLWEHYDNAQVVYSKNGDERIVYTVYIVPNVPQNKIEPGDKDIDR